MFNKILYVAVFIAVFTFISSNKIEAYGGDCSVWRIDKVKQLGTSSCSFWGCDYASNVYALKNGEERVGVEYNTLEGGRYWIESNNNDWVGCKSQKGDFTILDDKKSSVSTGANEKQLEDRVAALESMLSRILELLKELGAK